MKKLLYKALIVLLTSNVSWAQEAPKQWTTPKVDRSIALNILYLPISNDLVKTIPIKDSDEKLVDLVKINNPRLKPLSRFSPKYKNSYQEFSYVRLGVYKKLLKMLEFLPKNVGIAYFEGLRPLNKQKEYFDKKFIEILKVVKDKEMAYQETTKHVSPFIDNIPTHATGAAIDMTLFSINGSKEELMDMEEFDSVLGTHPQQETFCENTTARQRANRLMLLTAATKAGFVNYGYKWWLYSYGDKMWAYVKKKKEALYGLAVSKDDPILSIDKETYLQSFDMSHSEEGLS